MKRGLKRTGLHKEVFVVPKYFNNILGTYSLKRGHSSLVSLNQTELWFYDKGLSKVGGVISYQFYPGQLISDLLYSNSRLTKLFVM